MIEKTLAELGNQIRIRPRYDNFIGGQWVAPVKGQYFTNLTPVTGKPICEIARSTAEDIELALDAAYKTKDRWAQTSPAERAGMLLKIADRLEANLKLIATVETLDNGKPIRETMAADIPLAIDHFRYFAGCIRAQEGAISEIDHDTIAYHFHEPLGVVGQIIPWNFPILMAAWKLAPALAAGNCVILKPAEQTPMGIMVVMDVIGDILPPGVLNVVNGFGVEAGKPLATNKRISKVAFTGETTTGRLIMQYASENIIPVTLELGGKSPNIVFADAPDLRQAAKVSAAGIFRNSGQVCVAGSRLLVERSIQEEFVALLAEETAKMKVGDPLDPATSAGAVNSLAQLEQNLGFVEEARALGRDIRTGGDRILQETGGFYMAPTIVTGVEPGDRLARDEVFGPVLAVTAFDGEDEAVAMANATDYGLAAAVWTNDLSRAHRMVRRVKAGVIHVNTYGGSDLTVPLGGVKQSGNGHDKSLHAFEKYLDLKTAWFQL